MANVVTHHEKLLTQRYKWTSDHSNTFFLRHWSGTDLEKAGEQKCSTGQRLIFIKVTSYKIHTFDVRVQYVGFWNFLVYFLFYRPNVFIFEPKVEKKMYGYFLHSICATDLNVVPKSIGITKLSTLKTIIFGNWWRP